MRITDSDCSCPKKQWHPPGHAKEHGPGIALDPAVDFKRVERGTQRCAQQKQPECCPGPLGYLSCEYLISATLIILYHMLASTSALCHDIVATRAVISLSRASEGTPP